MLAVIGLNMNEIFTRDFLVSFPREFDLHDVRFFINNRECSGL